MRHYLLASLSLVVLASACATDAADTSRDDRSPADRLGDDRASKEDAASRCGTACGAAECGATWDAKDAAIKYVCGVDADQGAFISTLLQGSEDSLIDTRTLQYVTAAPNDSAYGFSVRLEPTLETTGLSILFTDVVYAQGQAYEYGLQYELFAPDFKGPGEYSAELYVVMSETRDAQGKFSSGKTYIGQNCKLTVEAVQDAAGGFRGTFDCREVSESGGDGRIWLNGLYAVPASAFGQSHYIAKLQ